MKKIIVILGLIALTAPSFAVTPRTQLRRALNLIEKGNLELGTRELYRLSRLKSFASKRSQIKYTLGVSFTKMKLYHLASLQFIYVIKKGNRFYKSKSLGKMTELVEYLGDQNLFLYVVSRVKERDFPRTERDHLYFYFGVVYFKKDQKRKALSYFSKIKRGTPFYDKSLYYRGLIYAEKGQVTKSARMFRELSSASKGVTDRNRVAGLIGLARVLYQGGKFQQSAKIYRSIPRDTKYFHDALLENSWNFLRSGRFRSALSNFQSLHSKFYANYYQPESLILRSYVYLYICKYYEMEKVLDLFNKTYIPTLKAVRKSLKWGKLYRSYFNAVREATSLKDKGLGAHSSLPPVVVHHIVNNSDFKSYLNYLEKLDEERAIVASLPASWRRDRVGRNASYILKSRINTTEKIAGKLARQLLLNIKSELDNLSVSESYLRYDMLRGKREAVKKRIARKYVDTLRIDEKVSRNYYIQSGYEYWGFEGESWLDEIGNYHYLGQHSCE